MQLTQKQIQFIENRLIEDGVKYWDMRIELLDHIVTDIEQKLSEDSNFEELVDEAFIAIGWKRNFNGDNLCGVINEAQKNTQCKYRKLYKNEIKNFVKQPKNYLILFLVIAILYQISTLIGHKYFYAFCYVLIMLPMLYSWVLYFNSRIKIGRSLQLESCLGFATISFFFANALMLCMKVKAEDDFLKIIDLTYQKPILIVMTPISVILGYIAVTVYNRNLIKIKALKKQLLCN